MIRRVLVVAAAVLGAVFIAAPAAHAQYQPGEPGIVVIPSTVFPGELVTVEGFGCSRNAPVVIDVDGQVVAQTVAGDNAEGSFSATFNAPNAVGIYTVRATCGGSVLSTTLTVNPAAVSPAAEATGEPPLPATGSNLTLVLVRSALALLAVGGLVLVAVRRTRSRV